MPDPTTRADLEHALRNQIALVIGYCEILLEQAPPESALRADLTEMLKAATAALQILSRAARVPPSSS